jgi:hypothetical protein
VRLGVTAAGKNFFRLPFFAFFRGAVSAILTVLEISQKSVKLWRNQGFRRVLPFGTQIAEYFDGN